MNEKLLSPEEQLLREVSGLAVDEVLALCYTFNHKAERLRLYLDALRRRGGLRTQFAACLICFDLARKGDQTAQTEFNLLAETIRHLDLSHVDSLVDGDPYLEFVWELLKAQLEEMDDRVEAEPPISIADEDIAEVDLLSDENWDDLFEDFDANASTPALRQEYAESIERFFRGHHGSPRVRPRIGLSAKK